MQTSSLETAVNANSVKATPFEYSTEPSAGQEYLTFSVASEGYAISISSVNEIRVWTEPSPLPNAPEFVLGVINLRGTFIPLLNLAARLELKEQSTSARQVVIIAQIDGIQTGLLVDAVSDIISLSNNEMQVPPETAINAESGPPYVKSLTLVGEKVIRILDLSIVAPNLAEAT